MRFTASSCSGGSRVKNLSGGYHISVFLGEARIPDARNALDRQSVCWNFRQILWKHQTDAKGEKQLARFSQRPAALATRAILNSRMTLTAAPQSVVQLVLSRSRPMLYLKTSEGDLYV